VTEKKRKEGKKERRKEGKKENNDQEFQAALRKIVSPKDW
jgi:uncharacterized protein YaiI (UPF0178 family)